MTVGDTPTRLRKSLSDSLSFDVILGMSVSPCTDLKNSIVFLYKEKGFIKLYFFMTVLKQKSRYMFVNLIPGQGYL
jgi:hypothetical protein